MIKDISQEYQSWSIILLNRNIKAILCNWRL